MISIGGLEDLNCDIRGVYDCGVARHSAARRPGGADLLGQNG